MMKNLGSYTFKGRGIVGFLAAFAVALVLWIVSGGQQTATPISTPETGGASTRSIAYRPGAASTSKPLHGAAAAAELKKRGQYASLMGAVNQAMYGFKPAGIAPQNSARSFRASNAQQNFAAQFDERGVQVQTTKGESLRLQWQSVGREGAKPQSIAAGQVALDGEELQVRRDGATEWFRNAGSGLEQGFTLHEKPAGTGGEVRLTLAVSGLRAQTAKDHIALLDEEGKTALTYSKLKVWGADGKVLPARMEAKDGRILLAMRDKGARYPLTVDPLIASQQAYLKASNNTGRESFTFGISVAIFGNTVVVGASGEDNSAGATYVFTRNGNSWSQEAYLKASNNRSGNSFGQSVAIDGNTIVVGAVGEDGSAPSAGAAYVFARNGAIWSQQAYLKAFNAGANDSFGSSVDVDGDTVVVGAYQEDSNATGVGGNGADNSATDSGAAYVFTRSGNLWSQQVYLKASNTGASDLFGESVAIDDDSIVVGARQEDSNATGVGSNESDNSVDQAGAAYVFTRSGGLSGIWSQQAYLKASNTGSSNYFGTAVAISSDTVVVAAPSEQSAATGVNGDQSNNTGFSFGAAYVFVRSGGLSGIWGQQAYLKASNTPVSSKFGYSVAIEDDTLVAGAYFEQSNATGVNGDQNNNNANASGAAYVFARSGGLTGTWGQTSYLKASNTDAGDQFGFAVALSLDTVIVGAVGEDSNASGVNGNQADNSINYAGAAYIFTGVWVGVTQTGPNFIVNNGEDTNDGLCSTTHCSLREAIAAANANADNSVITFDTVIFGTPQTILLNGNILPNIAAGLTITGPSIGVTVDANNQSQILQIGNGGQGGTGTISVKLSNMTFTRGNVGMGGTSGGIFNTGGTLVMNNCTLSNNISYHGGAIFNLAGTLMLNNCTLSGNKALHNGNTSRGGALYNRNEGATPALAALTNCTLSGNSADDGGAINNFAYRGRAETTVINCTLSGNQAGHGGGIYNGTDGYSDSSAKVMLGNTILNNNTRNLTDDNGNGTIGSYGHNLSSDNSPSYLSHPSDYNNIDPKLDPAGLQDNGGLNKTIALQSGSPAINSGSNVLLPNDTGDADGNGNTTEQTPFDGPGPGFRRLRGGIVDIGAYEIPSLDIAKATVTEGDTGTSILNFIIKLSEASPKAVTVTYQTGMAGIGPTLRATAGTDYVAIPATSVTFAPGQTTKQVDVTINGDNTDEANEHIALTLSNATNAVIGTLDDGIIIDDDPSPTLSISDAQVTESNGGTMLAQFTITLSSASVQPVTVLASTNSSSGSPAATAGADYVALVDKVITFAAGQTTQTLNVSVPGDTINEPDEKFGVRLSGAVNAVISDNTGIGTILDNDTNLPIISAGAPNLTEGNSGTNIMTFTLKLSSVSGKPISVQYQTANAATLPATAGSDYTALPLATAIFQAGETIKTVNVTVKGDLLDEPNERITLALSNPVNATIGTITDGVIVDDDATPTLSINDLGVTESHSGTKLMLFTVTLLAPSGQTVTVNVTSSSGGNPAATEGSDYAALSSTSITFAPGQTVKQVSVTIYGDTTVEQNEKFGVILSGAVNATIADNSGIGTILNDDAAGAAALAGENAESPSGGEDAK